VGDVIDVNITINNANDLWLWDIVGLGFNSAKLKFISVTEGPFLQQAGQTMFVPSAFDYETNQGVIGDITNAVLAQTGNSGNGVIATLSFQVLSLGTSVITFDQINLIDVTNQKANPLNPNTIPSTSVNTEITVGLSITSTSPTPASTSNPSPTSSGTVSPSTSPAPTSIQTNRPTTTGTGTTEPTSQGNLHTQQEFPTLTVLMIGLILVSIVSILFIINKKSKKN
jgi:hypothetical protein